MTEQMATASSEGRTANQSQVSLSQVIMPDQAGPGGVYAHGGEIIKLMDTAAGLAALRHARAPVVTLRVESINFHHPIRIGNYVQVQARLTYTSRTTMEIQAEVTAEDILNAKNWEALTAYFIFVALGEDGKPRPVPPLIVTSEKEQQLYQAGAQRHDTCRLDEYYRTLCAVD